MFSRFSTASWRVIRAAEQECRNHNHYYIGAEHLLEALLQEHDPAIVSALEKEHIDIGEVHAEVRRALGTGDDRMWEGILITPRIRTIIAHAEKHAGDRDLEPFDLYEGLRKEGRSLAAQILRQAATARPGISRK